MAKAFWTTIGVLLIAHLALSTVAYVRTASAACSDRPYEEQSNCWSN